MPAKRIVIRFVGAGDAPRTITVRAGTPDLRRYLDAIP
jgi:hypothetical protein